MKKKYKINYKEIAKKTNDDIGAFFLELRKPTGLNQTQLAEKLGTSKQTVSKWEKGKGFPDMIYQLDFCKIVGISLEELHKGKIDLKKRKKDKINKIIYYALLSLLIILIPLFLFLGSYYLVNHNAYETSYLETNSDYSIDLDIHGMYVKTKDYNIIYISTIDSFIESFDKLLSKTDNIIVNIYYKNKLIHTTNQLDNIIIKLKNNKKIDIDKLKVKLIIIDDKQNTKEYKAKFVRDSIVLNLEDDKYLYKSKKLKSEQEIIQSLKDNGFKYNDKKKYWYKNEANKKSNIEVFYYQDNNLLSYKEKTDNVVKNIIYSIPSNSYYTQIYQDDNNVYSFIEKYDFNYLKNYVNCKTTKCYSSSKSNKIIEKYQSIFFVDS